MNDWPRIEGHLRAEYEGKADTLRQVWAWSSSFRTWIDGRGTDVRAVENGDVLAFLDHEEWGKGSNNKNQRKWAIDAVVQAARSLEPARARNPSCASAWPDQVPSRSPLGKAIARVMSQAKSEGDRRRWATALGTFARWCESRGISVEQAWPGDIDAFRRDYLDSGRTSPGEYIRVARRLVREMQSP